LNRPKNFDKMFFFFLEELSAMDDEMKRSRVNARRHRMRLRVVGLLAFMVKVSGDENYGTTGRRPLHEKMIDQPQAPKR
jgi:hypothetical protein